MFVHNSDKIVVVHFRIFVEQFLLNDNPRRTSILNQSELNLRQYSLEVNVEQVFDKNLNQKTYRDLRYRYHQLLLDDLLVLDYVFDDDSKNSEKHEVAVDDVHCDRNLNVSNFYE